MPNLGEPPVLPNLILPTAPVLPRPVLEVPRAELPSYKPLVVPPSQLRPPPGVEGDVNTEETPEAKPYTPPPPVIPEVTYFDVPGTDHSIPIPSNEILVTSATTAVVSVAVTLTATSMFKRCVSLFKPIVKQLWSRLTKKPTSSHS